MHIAYRNFTGGEMADTLSARYDLDRYQKAAQRMENFLPNLHGDAVRRPGLRFLAVLDGPAVLLPFSFNTDENQNFLLILSNNVLRVADGQGRISATLSTPYKMADLYAVSHRQVGDVVYLAHRNYALAKVVRSGTPGAYRWHYEAVQLNASLEPPQAPTVTFTRNNAEDTADLGYTLRYKIAAVDAKGKASLPSPAGEGEGKHPADWVVGNRVEISWPAVEGATEYNIYREEAGYYGFIGIATDTVFMDNNYEADTSDTPQEDWNPFADGNHPATVAFHQQRLILGGTKDAPQSFYMSRTGDFENFRKSRPLMDDDPVEYALASGSIDAIRWLESFGDLLIGTAGAEYKATGEGGVITAKSVNITSQSYWGSAGLAPIIVGNSVLHVQRHGAHVRDLFYSLERDGYAGNDLSILAAHLFDGHTLKQWAYQQSPGSRVWIVRDDGVLLCLSYMKEHDISGFTRHVTEGEFLSVTALSGDNEDAVFFVVRRGNSYTLERLETEFGRNAPIADAFFVDCGVTRRYPTPAEEVDGLGHLEGRAVVALLDGSPAEGFTVKGGKISLPYPARVAHVGLPYASILSPFPLEADMQTGSTLGKKRAYGKCLVRLFRSSGGLVGQSENLEEMTEIPFLPAVYGEAVEPFSGDVEVYPAMEQAADASLWIAQTKPLPFQVVALVCDVDFGEA